MRLGPDLPTAPSLRYARFSRRLRAIVVDWFLALTMTFGAMLIAIKVGSDDFSRALGLLVIAALLLYEPILVSFTGGTLGHYFTNLRVVDDRNSGNVSFLKACARVVIKGLLGWYSFVVLAATRRNQAIHDLLTRSTVQIRDPVKALPGQYVTERSEPERAGMPSRWRRVVVICGYLMLLVTLAAAIDVVLLSPGCLDRGTCSPGERILSLSADVVLLIMMAAVVALGWRGRLFGVRKA